jgi:hypothetical protein
MPRAEDAKDATDSKGRAPVEAEAGRRRAYAIANRKLLAANQSPITNHFSLLPSHLPCGGGGGGGAGRLGSGLRRGFGFSRGRSGGRRLLGRRGSVGDGDSGID